MELDREEPLAIDLDGDSTCQYPECEEPATVAVGTDAESEFCAGHGAGLMLDLSKRPALQVWFLEHPEELQHLLANLGVTKGGAGKQAVLERQIEILKEQNESLHQSGDIASHEQIRRNAETLAYLLRMSEPHQHGGADEVLTLDVIAHELAKMLIPRPSKFPPESVDQQTPSRWVDRKSGYCSSRLRRLWNPPRDGKLPQSWVRPSLHQTGLLRPVWELSF